VRRTIPDVSRDSDNLPQETSPTGEVSFSVYGASAAELEFLAGRLRDGEVVAIPTETVYGLAADALNAEACASIFRIKGRPLIDPLIVHIHDESQLDALAETDSRAHTLVHAFWPGPLTIVLKKRACVPDIVTAGMNTVAVRMPGHSVARALLEHAGIPLAAPSANPFGYISPTTAGHVAESLGNRVRYILDGGRCAIGVESTIVDLSKPDRVRILRPGKVTAEEIAAALEIHPAQVRTVQATPPSELQGEQGPVLAPGMLERHYSPRTPVRLVPTLRKLQARDGEAMVYLQRPEAPAGKSDGEIASGTACGREFWFSENGDAGEVARNLYDLLRRLDSLGFRALVIEVPADEGLGRAIVDRLKRAASRC